MPPTGTRMDDGFPVLLTCAGAPNISLWPKAIKPPGFDGGEKIPTSTMLNVEWNTFAPRKLKTLTNATMRCAYDPRVLSDLRNQININQLWTVHFPTNGQWEPYWTFYGFLKSAEPAEMTEGTQPEVNVQIEPTNVNSSNAETAPTYATSSTTTTTTTTVP